MAYVVPRPEHITNLTRCFFEGKMINNTHFGVVIGPSGSSKTYLMTKLCTEYKSGHLYHEILEPEPDSFISGLSQAVDMKVAPGTILNVMLSYFTDKYTQYYALPDLASFGLNMLLQSLGEAAKEYKVKHNCVPVLFIDGVDLLAKHDERMCRKLITAAKIMANSSILKIVLISSEGSILPIEELYARNRARIYEVDDIYILCIHTYIYLYYYILLIYLYYYYYIAYFSFIENGL